MPSKYRARTSFTKENAAEHHAKRAAKIKAESEERVGAFLERTGPALLEAMQAAFTKQGCTPEQSRLVNEYVAKAWASRSTSLWGSP